AAGTYGLSGEGWFDPHGLLQAFKRKARSLGVTYINDEVVAMQTQAHRIRGVDCAQSGRHDCAVAINAAGARAARIASMAGIEHLPVHSRKRFIFMFKANGAGADWPLVVDPGGVYFRPEGNQFLCGVSPDHDPDCEDFEMDHHLFE